MNNTSTRLKGALQIHNSRFITYSDETLTVDVLGGVDTQQIERMICTLRVTYQSYPPLRSTLDLYNDNQTDKLIRTICDKWNLQLTDSSKSVHTMIAQLETYKLKKLKYPQNRDEHEFEQTEEEAKIARQYLEASNLINNLKQDLEQIGILGEAENALILFLAMASHKFSNPFSVLCLAKSGIGKSYLLQKLSECMPQSSSSFHTQISENALYYFDSHQIDGKVLFIEDLEWTQKMLMPLATLQTQGKLIKTRATKDKDGMLHSTTFEVVGKLCLIGCAYSEKSYDQMSLPFLCLHLNHSPAQDLNIMEYQKKFRAGLINQSEIAAIQRKLKCVLANLQNVSIINPYAPLIELPEDLPNPRKTFLLLLNFIDIITYFHQAQRATQIDKQTGEVFTLTHPDDIELAFSLLKGSLLRRVDDLSTTARGFYNWLQKFLTQAKTDQFTALDIRKTKRLHPRTLNRYLQELALFHYIQIVGGNKHREGYRYKLTNISELDKLQNGIEQSLKKTMQNVQAEHLKNQKTEKPEPQAEPKLHPGENRETLPTIEGSAHTHQVMLSARLNQFTVQQLAQLAGKSKRTIGRHLQELMQSGTVKRNWQKTYYCYTLTQAASKSVSQNPVSNTQSQ